MPREWSIIQRPGPTRAKPRRHKVVASCLFATALALVLVGTAASLAYGSTPDPVAASRAAASTERSAGLGVHVGLDIDTPVGAIDPVHYTASPSAARALPLPGASLGRVIAVDEVGLGVDATLELLAGDARAPASEAPADVAIRAQRATLAPASLPLAAAAAALTLTGAIVYFWTGIKTWAARLAFAPLLGLYAKITRAEVFDNNVRERIFTAIRDDPGLSASDLARKAAVSWGTTIYHLDVLEQTRMVTSLRKGRYRRYFENGANLTASKDVVALLQNPVTAGVVDTIRRTPGATQKELAAATSMSPQALHWHLTRLVATGMVRKEREGRVVRHFSIVTP